jgi:lysine 6-dehydrogenase
MPNKILVLGAGRVGHAMALDLARSFQVTTADISAERLQSLQGITETFRGDLTEPELLLQLASEHDLIVGALPGDLGYRMIETLIPLGKPIVDISFFPQDARPLDRLARKHGTLVIYDCGVAPGMGNIILGHHDRLMDVASYRCVVGGLPKDRIWPWEYKAVFSPYDVIEEYTRPARYRQSGVEVVREALSEPELVHFEGIGTLEAWNSDGLRSLLHTMRAPDMIEKTLRYPGSIEYLRVLRDSGFFSKDEVDIKGQLIRPLDLTAHLLMKQWELKPGDREFTVMKVEIEGTENGSFRKYCYTLHDEGDAQSGVSSMARTTGYTCTAIVHLISGGHTLSAGCHPPEILGMQNGALEYILQYQKERGINYRIS